jgi:hypothetical protein
MNDEALRTLIRESIARHLGGAPARTPLADEALRPLSVHPSTYRYGLPESDGPCIIEPGVACNHCGYCQSHGH